MQGQNDACRGKMMRTGFGAKHHGFNLTHLGMKKTPGRYVCTFSEFFVFDQLLFPRLRQCLGQKKSILKFKHARRFNFDTHTGRARVNMLVAGRLR